MSTVTPTLPPASASPPSGLARARRRLGRTEADAAAAALAAPGGLRKVLAPVVIITLLALLAPLAAPHGSLDIVAAGPLHKPSFGNLLGTDEIGRDVFSRVLYGIRSSWLAAVGVIVVGAAFGSLVGALAGAFGGWTDTILMRLTDLFLALPAPVLAIAVIASLGPSLMHTLLALSIVWWPWYARIVRGEVRALAARPHAEAARLAGVSRSRLVRRHLLPGAITPVVVTMSLDVGNLILSLAGLSFIGLGAPAPAAELGAMSARGLDYLFGHPWVPIAPAAAVALLALTANLLGDHVNRTLDQRTTR
ncbi:ABC transporter permease [Paraconexibacter antarcticus]|uniref:ABC transporter permease n=1 Tax=Paraconexibacter antarcticus TaxID=2949664 RepID=A0ABY5DWE6_9ACTN|nr:ABC transporter permease [Paraconexibacter antarcticus]UTI65249.1 ABC transporter permease [Paraconexibacter antarcticus]